MQNKKREIQGQKTFGTKARKQSKHIRCTYLWIRRNAVERGLTCNCRLKKTWSLVIKHFGLRGRQENCDLRVELFKFAKYGNGYTYVAFAYSNPMKTIKSPNLLISRSSLPVSTSLVFPRLSSAFPNEFVLVSLLVLKSKVP